MAGNIGNKVVHSLLTLTSSGSSLANGSAGSAGTTLDGRASGNADADIRVRFELIAQWATITGIIKDKTVAEIYLLPTLDGTNYPDIDTTATSSALPASCFECAMVATKAPTANTDARFISRVVNLAPMLYTAYMLNRSGQTVTANWTLKAHVSQAQYT